MSSIDAIKPPGKQTGPDSQLTFPGRPLILGCVSLVLAGLLLMALYVSLSPTLKKYTTAASREDIRPWTVQGSDLIPRMGQGESTESDALAITQLQQGIDTRGIFTRRVRLNTADYPFLGYNISGRHAGVHVYFIWRTAEDPKTVHNAMVTWAGDGVGTVHLGLSEQWQGSVTEVGLDVYGDLRDPPIVVENLSLLPSSGGSLLNSIWTEWTDFQVWSQKSTHRLEGVPSLSTLSPTVAMAAWAVAGVLLLALIALVIKVQTLPAFVLAICVPWISLDLLWQKNLSTQLSETKVLFSNKSQHEKHLADREHELYQYAQHLKNNVLPPPGARIFLLEKGPVRGYRRLKLQYYLLPHNLFNFFNYPQPHTLRPGDLIIVQGSVPGLEYSVEGNTLLWSGNSLSVEQMDDHEMGSVYQFIGEM